MKGARIARHEGLEVVIGLGGGSAMATTGSEANCGALITNRETREKAGFSTPAVFTEVSIIEPEHFEEMAAGYIRTDPRTKTHP